MARYWMDGRIVFALFLLLCVGYVRSQRGPDGFLSWNHKLKYDLMNNYDKDLRPVKNVSQAVVVKFGMALISLLDIAEERGMIEVNIWGRFQWKDIQLVWNPDNYDGLSMIRLDISKIWKPDITLYNSHNSEGPFARSSDHLAVVSSSGQVLWIPPSNLQALCSFDLTNFPYDKQICKFKFGSWTYDGFKLDLDFYNEQDSIDFNDYVPSNEWEIGWDTRAKKNMKYYPCCDEPYPDLTFTMTLKRNSSFFVHFYISPAVILLLMLPFMFLVRPGSNGKAVIGAVVMICSMMLITAVVMLPAFAKGRPTIMIYYVSILVLAGLCMVVGFLVDALYECRAKSGPPLPIRNLFISCLGKLVCVNPDDFQDSETKSEGQEETGEQVNVKAGIQGQWKALAVAINRLLFIIFMTVVIIITLAHLA